jgi:hypothetical protein
VGVVTTILAPTEAIARFCNGTTARFPLIVIGDRKSPPTWTPPCEGVEYVDVEAQEAMMRESAATTKLGAFVRALPWNHISRKNLGFLLAIKRGACRVWDFDDDNVFTLDARSDVGPMDPLERWTAATAALDAAGGVLGLRPRAGQPSGTVINPYTLFNPSSWLWPRGVPLERVRSDSLHGELVRLRPATLERVAVVQAAASGYPDVDAAFRLTRDCQINFNTRNTIPLVLLADGALAPYNAHATLHQPIGLWATYLPIGVSGRVSDIWRAYVAQAAFAALGLRVAFTGAWVTHRRSSHLDLMADHKSESDLHKFAELVVGLIAKWWRDRAAAPSVSTISRNAPEMMWDLYKLLYEHHIINANDLEAVTLWFEAMDELGMVYDASLGDDDHHELHANDAGVVSPRVPSSLIQARTHTAVHINWSKWMVISAWHCMFSSLYGHVSYHVELPVTQRPQSPLDHLTHFHHYHGPKSGSLSYDTLLYVLAGSVQEARAADVIVWHHDDIFLDARWVARWAADVRRAGSKSSPCVAIAGFMPMTSMTNWSTASWAQRDDLKFGPRAMMANDQAHLNYTFCPTTAERPGESLASLFSYSYGASDAVLLAPRCANFPKFVATLSVFSRAQMFIELAIPTAVSCGLAPEDRTEFPILTQLTSDRRNTTFYLRNLTSSATPQHPTIGQYHPVKMRSLMGLFAQLDMRDFVFKHTSIT